MVKYSKLTAKQLETMTREERREARKDEKGYGTNRFESSVGMKTTLKEKIPKSLLGVKSILAKDFLDKFDEDLWRKKFETVVEDDEEMLEELIDAKRKKHEKSQCVSIIEQVREKDGSAKRIAKIAKLEKEIEAWRGEIEQIESVSPSVYATITTKGKSGDGSFGCGFKRRLDKIPAGEAFKNGGVKCSKCPKFYWGKVAGEKHEAKCNGKKVFAKVDSPANRLSWRPS